MALISLRVSDEFEAEFSAFAVAVQADAAAAEFRKQPMKS
jgi:hypothetical protein